MYSCECVFVKRSQPKKVKIESKKSEKKQRSKICQSNKDKLRKNLDFLVRFRISYLFDGI